MTNFDFRNKLPEPIFTERLILRAPSHDDIGAMTRLANSKKIHDMLARLPHPYTRDHAVDFIDNIARSDEEHAFSILTRDENYIGVIGLHLVPGKAPELGYWLGEPYWGEGYASEAVAALIAAAEAAGCTTIDARAQSVNTSSIRVLEKSGFTRLDERIDDCGVRKGIAVTCFTRERQT